MINIEQLKIMVVKAKKDLRILKDIHGKCITPRLIRVIEYRFGLEDGVMHTLEETGKEFGVARERVRQIQANSLAIFKREYGLKI